MRRRYSYNPTLWFTSLLLILVVGTGCRRNLPSGEQPPIPVPKPNPTPEVTYPEGISTEPENPKADEALTIIFHPEKSNPLYNATGELYAHIGVVEGQQWLFVPAEWGTNLAKAQFTKVEPNLYQLKLMPSIRKWFGAGDHLITKIGLVIRNADGSQKAYNEDYFIAIQDRPIEHPALVFEGLASEIQEGITIHQDGSVTLALNDQDKHNQSKYKHAYLIGTFNDWQRVASYAMKRDKERGLWWVTLRDLDPDKEYAFQYQLFEESGSQIRVADPYTEKVLTPDDQYIPASTYPHLSPYPDGQTYGTLSTFRINAPRYQWQVEHFQAPPKEQLMIYEMHLRDFSSSHDIRGALKQLDRLKEMGFNAIELMPIQEFTGNDSWGYNPTYYFAMDKAYGTKEGYQHFIDECHKRGIAVILDVVYNHMDADSPFVQLYSDGQQIAPNNPFFNQVAPHPYSVFFDFNHESQRTRKLVKRNLQFLLKEYRVDGFRFDLTKGFTQKKSNEATAGQYDASRVAILKDYHQAIQQVNPKAFTILEHFCDLREERELAEAGMMLWKNMNHAYAQAAMGYQEGSDFAQLYTGIQMPHASLVGYMESHDEERIAFKQKQYGLQHIKESLEDRVKRLKLNALFFFTVPGPKMVWQYGEYAYDHSINENGRTGRKPIWGVELTEPMRIELAEYYGKLLQLRQEYADLFTSDMPFAWSVGVQQWSKLRIVEVGSGAERLIIVGNFHPVQEQSYTLAQPLKDLSSGEVVNPRTLTIPASTYRIFVTQ